MRISAREYERLPEHLQRLFYLVDGSDEVVAYFDQFGERQSGDASVINSNGYDGLQGGKAFARAPTSKSYRGANSGSAARFFFSAKAGKEDRWGSRHPTVKPVELLKWLVPLVTPPGGTVLDPFAGSGTTAVAALATGRNCILIEREAVYCEDIKARLAHYDGDGKHSLSAKGRKVAPERSGADGTPLFAAAALPATQREMAQPLCDSADIASLGCSDD